MDSSFKQNIKIPDQETQWGKRNSAGVSIASAMSFENISYSVSGQDILSDISLEVEPGEVLCLLGPSGSGKTSLLRIAAGLARANSGSVKIDKRIIADETQFIEPEKRGVGLVFQDYALFPHLTILQNVEFGLTSLSRSDAREQAIRMLERVGLESRADQYPQILSGGEQQRVALARALAPRPSILLMDEPFSGLDSRLRDVVREQTIELLRETRSTTIIVTHDAEEALRVGDHIALIRDGKLVQAGTGHELYYHPNNLFAAGFFSELNVIPAEIRNGHVDTAFGELKTELADSENASIAIRLTDLKVKPYIQGAKGRVGRVFARQFIGRSELLDIHVEDLDTPIQARIGAGELSGELDLVQISVKPELMMIFSSDAN